MPIVMLGTSRSRISCIRAEHKLCVWIIWHKISEDYYIDMDF